MKSIITCCLLVFLSAKNSFCQAAPGTLKTDTGRLVQLKLTVVENSEAGGRCKTFLFTKNKFRIYEKPFDNQNYTEHLYTNHKFNSKELFREILKLNFVALNEAYFNNCMDSAKGYDYSIIMKSKSQTTSIKLHHYFIKEVDALVVLLNNYLPSTLQIKYLPEENKQDCGKPN
jgi:hypothetical protein